MFYRIYDFIKISIPNFFRNIWLFRNELSTHRWWDYSHTLSMMKRSLELTSEGLKNKGNEVIEERSKKIEKIDRAIYLIDLFIEDDFTELARLDLNIEKMPIHSLVKSEKGHYEIKTDNPEDWEKIFSKSEGLKRDMWEELWDIFRGSEKKDGTDLRGWWD